MVLQSQALGATRTAWQIDPGSTYVTFGVRHMGVSTVRGRFPDVRGTIVVDEADPAASVIDLAIGTASLDTGNTVRDSYVRTDAYLDVEQFPEMTFRSVRIEPLAGGPQVLVAGEMTIRGITREVTLDARYNGAAETPFGGWVAGFEGRATLTLADFGILGNLPLPGGGNALGATLAVEILVEATKGE